MISLNSKARHFSPRVNRVLFSLLLCRNTLQRLKEFSQEQQEDLAKRQEKLQEVHDHLFENSKSMLEAQVSPPTP